ncbi:hypothetical protein L0F81_22310 [Streptomyces tricolor]|uniref:Uncharacterized protein n=1 Tax=Streptomyces tricolor TaxID=68277 RepID=A0ABS9JKA5_9ACTN|nr:hypothetical protein [Streptomyces tricolor]MCG0065996.1 hypothetical protein [Streptomyces tricolor]
MTATTQQQTARDRLLAEMERLFADDAGLGALVPYNGRPDMTEEAKEIQMAWARALVAVHGRDRAASVYTKYAGRRQRTVTATIGSWANLVLATKPIPRWDRDIHGFLCFSCVDTFATVVDADDEQLCNRCAREHSAVETTRPLWHAYSHSKFQFPGLMAEERTTSESQLLIRYQDGEERAYVTGEAALLAEKTSPLPGFTVVSGQTHGDSRDTINLTVETRAERQRRSVEILATFAYDPEPEQWEGHAYGFRFVSARLTARSRQLGQLDLADPTVTEHTDLYRLLDALITHLYGSQE